MHEQAYKAHERWQGQIEDYRNRLMEIARADAGFSGAEIRHETHELIIFGVGEPSKSLVAVMEEAPSTNSGGARHDGTSIDFTTTDRSLLEADDPQSALATRYPVSITYGEPATYG
ncbi:MAG TPA: hypothetical protein VGK78_00765 [Nocardioides sp.]|uniref:hypothetical protein n=1 Tax=Nocardioides sp. TaxID=35761 RepID=UPI002F411F2D